MAFFSFLKNLFQKKSASTTSNLDQKLIASLKEPRFFPRFRQFRMLPVILNRKEKRLVQFGLLILILAAAIYFITYLQNPAHYTPASGGVLRAGLVGAPRFINPVLPFNEIDADLGALIYSSLLKYDTSGNLINDLTEKYETTDNGKTYLFTLKKALWHDGESVKASDVVFTINAIQSPSWHSPFWRSFRGIKAEAIDDNTVKFTLDAPFSFFPSLLTVGILPAHLWQTVDPNNLSLAVWNIQPVGSGPWAFSNLTKNPNGQIQSYTLEKNTDYYEPKPWLDKITFFFYDNTESAVQALKEGRLDSLAFVPPNLKDQLPAKRVNIYQMGIADYTAVFFNDKRNDFLKTSQIRKAFSLMIDKKALAGQVGGEPILGPFLNQPIGDVPDFLQNSFDENQAAKLLSDAGLTKKDGFWQKKDKPLALTLTVLNTPLYRVTADYLKIAWEKNGIKINVNILEVSDFKQAIKNRDYEALLWSQILNRDQDLFPFWHSSQTEDPGLNLTNLRNHTADVLLEQARQTADTQKRWSTYLDFQKILNEEMPAVFLFKPSYFYALSKKVGGVKLEKLDLPADRFNGLSDWFIQRHLKLW